MAKPAAEVEIPEDLVRSLLHEQHADLATLPLRRLAEGWDNVIWRLGDDLIVRLPRRQMGAVLVRHEQRWLPELAAGLPLPVPVPVRMGVPGCGYPWAWSVCPWLPGVEIERAPPADWGDAARQLGGFLAALHRPAPADAPPNPYRGVPLADRAERFEQGVRDLADTVDGPALHRLWDELVATPAWPGPAMWLHGDVHPLNLLVHEGRLAAVIDFGDLTAGDPASDLAGAWTFLPAAERAMFRAAAGRDRAVDDHTWSRARGWALALGVAMANGDDRVAVFGRRALQAALHGT